MPTSRHQATISLRRVDMKGIGGYDIWYYECSCTTKFSPVLGCLDIACISNDMVSPAD